MSPSEKRKLIRFLSKLQDEGSLAPEESEFLNALLSRDPDARKAYYQLSDMEQELESAWHAKEVVSQTETKTPGKTNILRFPLLKIAASLVVGSTLTFFYLEHKPGIESDSNDQIKAQQEWVGTIQQHNGTLRFNGENVAVPNDLFVGNYTLDEGFLSMEFYEGVSVQAEAPCEFQILSPNQIEVSKGSLAAKVFDARSSFRISNRTSVYIDLGTEFAVNFEEDGKSDLHVYEGEVLASSLSNDGDSERVKLVTEQESLSIGNDFQFVQTPVEEDQHQLHLEYQSPPPPALNLNSSYSESILKSKPEAYWKLDGSLKNEIEKSNALTLRELGNEGSFVLAPQNSFYRLKQSSSFNALVIDQELNLETNAEFSVELWVCADRFDRATVFGLYDSAGVLETGETNHVAIVDFMHKSLSFHHVPSAIRTAYRPIASDDYYSGINMFTKFHYVPGEWTHIVLVKATDYIATHINGEQTSYVPLGREDELKAGSYAAIFGQMSIQNWDAAYRSQKRPFTGGMDEIALYKRPLTSDEIKQHYNVSQE